MVCMLVYQAMDKLGFLPSFTCRVIYLVHRRPQYCLSTETCYTLEYCCPKNPVNNDYHMKESVFAVSRLRSIKEGFDNEHTYN